MNILQSLKLNAITWFTMENTQLSDNLLPCESYIDPYSKYN